MTSGYRNLSLLLDSKLIDQTPEDLGEVSFQRRGATSFLPNNACGRKGFIEFRSLWYLGYQYLYSQASSLRLLIVRSSSWDVVELSQRVLNFEVLNFDEPGLWTGQSAL